MLSGSNQSYSRRYRWSRWQAQQILPRWPDVPDVSPGAACRPNLNSAGRTSYTDSRPVHAPGTAVTADEGVRTCSFLARDRSR